eukprot:TRINITY_DN2984_c0_g1_i4.p2 TRINITY_DN2984_c0_g1~~TRINITY_DN2984_c0_g1_i4.p2  ORF type:complete len:325 (+),score=98.57 TRINITY_DN2984_c0_g1_i4:1351-2325(+)
MKVVAKFPEILLDVIELTKNVKEPQPVAEFIQQLFKLNFKLNNAIFWKIEIVLKRLIREKQLFIQTMTIVYSSLGNTAADRFPWALPKIMTLSSDKEIAKDERMMDKMTSLITVMMKEIGINFLKPLDVDDQFCDFALRIIQSKSNWTKTYPLVARMVQAGIWVDAELIDELIGKLPMACLTSPLNSTSIWCTALIFKQGHADDLLEHVPKVLEIISKMIRDGDPDAKSSALLCYFCMCRDHLEMLNGAPMDAFFDALRTPLTPDALMDILPGYIAAMEKMHRDDIFENRLRDLHKMIELQLETHSKFELSPEIKERIDRLTNK